MLPLLNRSWLARALLAIILLAALSLRLYGINWDQGYLFHPDERAILMKVEGGISLPWPPQLGKLLDAKESPLNPHWFPYGTLPLYLLKLSAHLLSFIKASFASQDLRLVGRALAALFDTGTIFLVFLLGRRLYGSGVGLLAAAFAAFTVLHIQSSHFFAVDVFMVFFIMLTLYLLAGFVQRGERASALLAGAAFGLALASKVSAAPLLFSFVASFLLYSHHEGAFSSRRLKRGFDLLLLALLVAGATFLIAEPYALIDRDAFFASVSEQSEMVRRIRDYPYTRQYENTIPFLYQIWQTTNWGMGLPLGLVGWIGILYASIRAFGRGDKADLLLLSWFLPYFLVTGSFAVKFLRYMLPLTPILALVGARMLLDFHSWAKGRDLSLKVWHKLPPLSPLAFRRTALALVGIALVGALLYSLAYVNIYSRPHPAVQLSRRIGEEVPKGALILKEHWEEGLPGLGAYRQSDLNLYEPDDARKLQHITSQLAGADYILFYSNRLYGTIPRLPERYPLTTRYYQLLFSGELGYELVDFAASYPSLLGVSLVDETFARGHLTVPGSLASYKPTPLSISGGYADESFTVYDHPKVMLFKRVRNLGEGTLQALLAPSPPSVEVARKVGLLLSEADLKANQEGGTWSQIFQRDSMANRFPLPTWLVWIQLISLIALPLGLTLFRYLPDKGYLLAKALGILLLAYLHWLVASLHLLPSSRNTILLALLLITLLSGYLFWRQRAEIWAFFRRRWQVVAIGETLFLVAFLVFYAIRLWNPDLWHPWRGGEKPMDFAYLNAVIRSTYFPPHDPWFSGGYLNYYYFGQVIVGTLVKLSGIVPAVAYNLAIPLLFSLTLGSAFSLGYNLMAWRGGERLTLLPPLICGLAAALFVGVIGNLDGLLQLLEQLWKVGGLGFQSSIPGLAGAVNALAGLRETIIKGRELAAFDYWRSSRMMPPSIAITEFPFFTFLFADLHAHLIALPFALLTLALSLALVVSSGKGKGWFFLPAGYMSSQEALLLLALSLALGALRITNSWDFPTYFLLAAGGLLIAGYHELGLRARLLAVWALKIGALYLLSTLLYLPFHQSYQLFYSGIQPSQEKTTLPQYLGVHGIFLFLVVSLIFLETYARFRGEGLLRFLRLVWSRWDSLPRLLGLRRRLVSTTAGVDVLALRSLVLVVALLLLLLLLRLTLIAFLLAILFLILPLLVQEARLRQSEMTRNLFLLLLIGLSLFLGMGVDLITIQGDIARMNTVFKFYLQGWLFLAIASAYALGVVLWSGGLLPSSANPHGVAAHRRGLAASGWGRLWIAFMGVLLVAGLIYPLAATPVRLRDRFLPLPPTNNGMAFMKEATYQEEKGRIELKWDYEAILWLQDNLVGSPTILEAVTPLYRWGSRVSVYTGLPTVIGWDWHQKQQRWGYQWMVDARLADVKTIYSTPEKEMALRLLRQYQVRYIYLGTLERLYYPAEGLAKFEAMVGKELELAYQNPEVKIYRLKA